MSIAEYVVGGRCPTCGHVGNLWPPAAITEAARAWAEKHGKPPRAHQWQAGTPEHPAKTTVISVFGTWNNMVAAAGLAVYNKRQREYWTRDEMAAAMLDHLLREGRWPGYREWQVSRGPDEMRPAASSVVRKFGSWNAAKLYAGWDGQRGSDGVRVELRCTGCGGELDNTTIGCASCWDRKRHRAKRAAARYETGEVVELPAEGSDFGAAGDPCSPARLVAHLTEKAA